VAFGYILYDAVEHAKARSNAAGQTYDFREWTTQSKRYSLNGYDRLLFALIAMVNVSINQKSASFLVAIAANVEAQRRAAYVLLFAAIGELKREAFGWRSGTMHSESATVNPLNPWDLGGCL
jgi:hypothetical protein